MTDDQKRALAIGGIGIGGFLLWRHLHPAAGVTKGTGPPLTSAGGASGSIAPYTPQAPLVLSPGESVYDPNSEGLLNTPTARYTDLPGYIGTPTDTSLYPSQASNPSQPKYTVNVNYPKQHARRKAARKPAKRKVVVK